MKFKLSIRNFKAFGDNPITVDFTKPGVTLIQGKNNSSKSKNSNGTGKSTLLEALQVTLYGLLSDVPKKSLVNLETGENCELIATVEDDQGNTGVITRRIGWKKGDGLTFVVNGVDKSGSEAATQERINDFLGLDRDTFLMSVLFTMSDKKTFAGETPANQDAIFTKILHLEDLTIAQKLATSHITDLNMQVTDLKTRIDRNKVRLSEIAGQKESASSAYERWEAQRQNLRNLLTSQLADFNSTLATIHETVEDYEALVEAKEVAYQVAKREAEAITTTAITTAIDELRAKQVPLDQRYAVLEHDISVLSAKQKKAQGLNGEVECPTCEQPLPKDSVATRILEMERDKATLQTEMSSVDAARVVIAGQLRDLNQQLRQATETQNKWAKVYQEWQQAQNGLKVQLSKKDGILAQIQQKQDEYNRLDQSVPPEIDISSLEAKEAAINAEIFADEETIRVTLLPEIEVYKFWETGYGQTGLRNLMIESLLPELNRIAAKYSETLTNGELIISFSAQKKLVTGDTRNKLCIEVNDLYGSDSYATSSGGERRRIDFIVNLALYSLISSRTHIPFVVFDEAFVKMDEAGIRFMLTLLDDLKQEIPSILIVANQDYVSSEVFDTRWIVERTGRTSTLRIV